MSLLREFFLLIIKKTLYKNFDNYVYINSDSLNILLKMSYLKTKVICIVPEDEI